MSVSVMTKDGELPVPTPSGGGGVNLELITRISLMEKEIADLKDKLNSALSEELAYLSGIEREIIKRKKAAQNLLSRLKKYG